MRELLLFLKHRLRWMLRQPQWLLLPLLFVALIALTQQLFSPQFSRPNMIPIMLINRDSSAASALLRARLEESALLEVRNSPGEDDLTQAQALLMRQGLSALFVIESGFETEVLAGKKQGLLSAYYNDNSIAAKLLSETVSAEVMRLLVTEGGLNFLAQVYEANGRPFAQEQREQHRQNIEYYWSQGLTFEPEIRWTETAATAVSTSPLGRIVAPTLQSFLAALCMAVGLSTLARERQQGILAGIYARGKSSFLYVMAAVLLQLAAFLLLLWLIPSAAGWGQLVSLGLTALWAALAVSLAAAAGQSQGRIILAAPLLLLLLSALAGFCATGAVGAEPLFLLNPIFCGLGEASPQAAVALLGHNGVMLFLLWRQGR